MIIFNFPLPPRKTESFELKLKPTPRQARRMRGSNKKKGKGKGKEKEKKKKKPRLGLNEAISLQPGDLIYSLPQPLANQWPISLARNEFQAVPARIRFNISTFAKSSRDAVALRRCESRSSPGRGAHTPDENTIAHDHTA